SPRGATRAEPASACTSSTVSSPIASVVGSIWIPSPAPARAYRSSCRAWRRWSRPRSRARRLDGLIDVGKFVQRRAKDLAGLADQGRPIHRPTGVGEGAGYADADRGRSAEQGIVVVARRRVTLHQHLAPEGVLLHRIGAGVEKV